MDAMTQRLLSTTDAMVWAEEWCRTAAEIQDAGGEIIDEGWMVGWFANAMGTQESHLHKTWSEVEAMHRSHAWRVFRDVAQRKCRECEDTDDTIMRYCPGGPPVTEPTVADLRISVPPLEQPGLF